MWAARHTRSTRLQDVGTEGWAHGTLQVEVTQVIIWSWHPSLVQPKHEIGKSFPPLQGHASNSIRKNTLSTEAFHSLRRSTGMAWKTIALVGHIKGSVLQVSNRSVITGGCILRKAESVRVIALGPVPNTVHHSLFSHSAKPAKLRTLTYRMYGCHKSDPM